MLRLTTPSRRFHLVGLVTKPSLRQSAGFHHRRNGLHTSSVTTAAAKDEVWLKSPRDLAQHLDTHIIGQERAKKVLAVAVFNHYHRVTSLLNAAVDQDDSGDVPSSDQGYLDSFHSNTDVSFNGSTAATATITPKPRRRKISGTTETSSASSSQDLFDGKYSDEDKFGIRRDMDPTLIHSPSEWSVQPGFYDKAFPPSPRYSEKPVEAPPVNQPSTLLGRLARASVSAARSSPVDSKEEAESPFSEIRATNSPPPARKKTSQTSSSAVQDERSGARQVKGESFTSEKQRNDETEDLECGQGEVSSKMDDIVIEKSNVLMIGPTGSGKTLLAKTLAKILDVPFASSDATSFTQAGYVGDDVENCVLRLLRAADYDVTRTEIGIIHIDECDKLARRGGGEGGWGGRDVGGEGVQQALLKLLEGTTVTLQAKPGTTYSATPGGSKSGDAHHRDPPMQRGFGAGLGSNHEFGKKGVREGLPLHGGGGGGASNAKGETFTVDTSNILFILSGSFVGLEKIISARIGKGSIGFGAILPEPKRVSETEDEVAEVFEKGEMTVTKKDRLKGLSTADLVEYGFIPEFVGRLPILAPLHPLSLSDLVRILVEPKNALTKQYRKLFERYGCDLRFSEKALYAVAEEASKRGGSARHLRSTLEELLLDAMYEVPGSAIRYAAVTEDVVRKAIPTLYFSRRPALRFSSPCASPSAFPTFSRWFATSAVEPLSKKKTAKSPCELPLEHLSKPDFKVPKMRQLDWEIETPRIMTARKQGRDVIDFRSPLFSIKAVRSAIVTAYTNNQRKYNPLSPHQQKKMPFGIITTIKSISKSAVERNRVRTRFKEAMRLALSRTPPMPQDADGNTNSRASKPLQLPTGYHFLATLAAGIYAEPIPSLVEQMRKAIKLISAGAEGEARTMPHSRKTSSPSHLHKARSRYSNFNN